MSIEKLIEANTSAIKELTAAVKALTEAKTHTAIVQAVEVVSNAVDQTVETVIEEIARRDDAGDITAAATIETVAPAEAPACTYDEAFDTVRKVAATTGGREKVLSILARYGADKLSGVKESDYGRLKADLERYL